MWQQTYCKPCLCAKHKEMRERKRMRGIQDHLNSTGQLHLVDPAHLADPNEDPYAGVQPVLPKYFDSVINNAALAIASLGMLCLQRGGNGQDMVARGAACIWSFATY